MNDFEFDLDATLDDMASDIEDYIDEFELDDYVIIGIHTGGAWIANELKQRLNDDVDIGELNIAFYRDDFSQIGMHPTVNPSNLPESIEDKDILLIDDVLYTGRTIRAAMNEIFDYGRPRSISLVVLIDRTGRELPIQADIIGKSLELNDNEHVKLTGPEPLTLVYKSE